MGFDDYEQAALKPGKTVAMKLDMLPRSPVVHLEMLGETNATYLNDQIAQANAKLVTAGSGGKKQLSKKRLLEMRERRADIISKHGIRKLEATHSNGKTATQDEIPEWVASVLKWTPDVIDQIWDFANNPEFYRDAIVSDTEQLAEK